MSRLYFSNVGRASAYKCITKGLNYEHVIEYLAISLAQSRVWELVYLTCHDSRTQPVPQSDLKSYTMQMQRVLELET